MNFDVSFISPIVNIAGFAVGGLIFAITLRTDLRALVDRVARLEMRLESVDRALAVLAVQEDRLNAFARRIERLEGHFLGVK